MVHLDRYFRFFVVGGGGEAISEAGGVDQERGRRPIRIGGVSLQLDRSGVDIGLYNNTVITPTNIPFIQSSQFCINYYFNTRVLL